MRGRYSILTRRRLRFSAPRYAIVAGGEIRFGAKVTSLGYPENGIVKKVKVEYSDVIERGLGKEETERINRMARERVGIGSEDIGEFSHLNRRV